MAYEKKILDSDRYQYLTEHREGVKVFKPGSVVRASFGDMRPLLELGIVKEVAMSTLCRVDPLAPGGCVPETNEDLKVTENKQAGEKSGQSKHIKK